MIVVQLQGGLGNQMFQYAAGKALSLQLNCSLKVDLNILESKNDTFSNNYLHTRSYELNIFQNLEIEIVKNKDLLKFLHGSQLNKIKRKLGLPNYKVYQENEFVYSDHYFNLKPPVLLKGYFQSENYFIRFEKIIRQSFRFPLEDLGDSNNDLLQAIQKTESVSIHVRRGDYLIPEIFKVHGICEKSYYVNAIERIKKKYPNASLYFFSDDAEWIQNNLLKYFPNSTLISGNHAKDSWKDMFLMSSCKHNIIANSSFSWWAAWLNNNPEKMIIAPRQWFKIEDKNFNASSLIPSNWISI
ncbi:MAG: alpha-1,2-fucosyltransferase [Bacteroidota bacterium]|nr:alpha-1,2-fucosyltransferase [Bacteroidota bacterium]